MVSNIHNGFLLPLKRLSKSFADFRISTPFVGSLLPNEVGSGPGVNYCSFALHKDLVQASVGVRSVSPFLYKDMQWSSHLHLYMRERRF